MQRIAFMLRTLSEAHGILHVRGPSWTVLVADDDFEMRMLLSRRLRRLGYDVVTAANGRELVDKVYSDSDGVDLVLADVRMPEVSGLEALTALRACHWQLPVILMTAFGDRETHAEGARLGAAAMLDKPFDLDAVCALIAQLVPAAGPR